MADFTNGTFAIQKLRGLYFTESNVPRHRNLHLGGRGAICGRPCNCHDGMAGVPVRWVGARPVPRQAGEEFQQEASRDVWIVGGTPFWCARFAIVVVEKINIWLIRYFFFYSFTFWKFGWRGRGISKATLTWDSTSGATAPRANLTRSHTPPESPGRLPRWHLSTSG